MSTPSEQSDSDSTSSSWILVDDGERDDTQETVEAREAIEEIHDWDESDGVSIISEPDEVNSDSSQETTLKPEEDAKEESVQTQDKNEHIKNLIVYPKNEVVPVPQRFTLSNSSLASAAFMMIGLALALYFHNGYEDDIVPDNTYKYTPINSKELIHEPVLHQNPNADIEYIETYNEKNNDRKFICGKDCNSKNNKELKTEYQKRDYKTKQGKSDKIKYEKSDHKNNNEKHEKKNHKNKKNVDNSYETNDKYTSEKNIKNKYYKTKDSLKHNKKEGSWESHEGYLMKKENFLKHKENKLKQKELKINARNYKSEKNFSNEKYNKYNKRNDNISYKNGKFNESNSSWYFKMHKGRFNKRKDQQSSDWLFDRAKARNKHNKNGWYFSWMEDREDIRFKKNFS